MLSYKKEAKMRPQLALSKLKPLIKQGYFTSKEARDSGVHPATINHYIKTGHLKRINRGVYQGSDYQNPSAFRWEDLIEAAHSVKGGVVCLISALAVYDLTEEIPRQHWIAIKHSTSTKPSKKLKVVRYRNLQLGREKMELEGTKISIFNRERTIIDAFRLLSIETAIKALKAALQVRGKNRIDLVKLQEYAQKLRFDITPYLMSFTT